MKIAEQKIVLLDFLRTQDLKKLDQFLKEGGNINLKLNNPRQTLLDLAVYEDKMELVRFLIENGADVNCKTFSGSTPIFSANSLKMAEFLVRNGADLSAKDKKGNTVLYYHISSKEKEIVAYLSKQMGEVWDEQVLKNVQPMEEDDYWKIVEKTYKQGKGDERQQAGEIVRKLRYMTPPEIMAFQKRTFSLANFAHTSNLWAAAYVINGGCSDDAFTDFKHWVISLGKSGFYDSIKTPDCLVKYLSKKASYVNYGNIACSSIEFAAIMAYEYRTGLSIYKVLDYSNVPDLNGDFELDWDENNIESKREIFPKLFKKYWIK